MQISKEFQEEYRKEIDALALAASQYVKGSVDSLSAQGATTAEIREFTNESIEAALNSFGVQACEISNAYFDLMAAEQGAAVTSKLYPMDDLISPEKLNEKLRFFAGQYAEGEIAGYTQDVTALTEFYVKRASFENLTNNCKDADIRFARVPSGRENCAFCLMLASRGFVYYSEDSANAAYHPRCDCIAVPGFDGYDNFDAIQIEGYDPDKLRENWQIIDSAALGENEQIADLRWAESGKSKPYQKFKQAISRDEMRTRFSDWVWNRTPAPFSASAKTKASSAELTILNRLNREGFEISTSKSGDFVIGAGRWNIYKNEGYNNRDFIDQLTKSKDAGFKRVVVSYDRNYSNSVITKIFKNYKESGLEEVLVLFKDGTYRIKL